MKSCPRLFAGATSGVRQRALRAVMLCLAFTGCSQPADDPEARYQLTVQARALFESGALDDAEGILKRVAVARRPEDLVNLGIVRFARGDAEAAGRAWNAARGIDPSNARALYHLAALHREMASGAAALARERPAEAEKLRARAERDLQRAVELLEPAAAAEPFDAAIPRLLERVRSEQGDSAVARAARLEAERLDPGRAGATPEVYSLGRIVPPPLRRPAVVSRTPPRFTETRLEARAVGVAAVDLGDFVLEGTGSLLRCDSVPSAGLRWSEARLLDRPIALARAALLDADATPDMLLFARAGASPAPAHELSPASTADASPPRARDASARREPADSSLQVWLVRGSAAADAAPEPVRTVPADIRDADFLDADRDGDLDVIVAADAPPGLRLWRNDGQGRFGAEEVPAGITAVLPAMRGVVAVDLDADGFTDLVCVDELYRVSVLAGRSSGFVDTSALAGLGGQRARALGCADLDADGDVDLLLGNDEGLWLWSNLGWGRFECRAAYRETRPGWTDPPRGVAVAAIAVADFDNDGLPDVLTLHFAEPPPVFATEVPAEPKEGEDTAAAARRLAPLLPVPAVVRPALWRNEGNGVFAEVADRAGIDRLALGPSAPVAADFDRDGDLDLACVGADSLVHLLWNQGSQARGLEVELVDPRRPANGHGARVEFYTGSTCRDVRLLGPVGWVGLGLAAAANVVRIVWPDGMVENHLDLDLPAGRRLRLVRGQGGS